MIMKYIGMSASLPSRNRDIAALNTMFELHTRSGFFTRSSPEMKNNAPSAFFKSEVIFSASHELISSVSPPRRSYNSISISGSLIEKLRFTRSDVPITGSFRTKRV